MKQKYHKYFVVLLSVVIFILPTKYVQAQNHPLSIDEAIIKWQNILVNSTTQRNVGADPIIPVLWKPLFIPANTSVLDIAIDPTNSAKIFLGTDNASMPVIYSNDFGRTWITQTLGLPDAGSTILDVDPISPNYVYVGFRVSEGVYRSDNGGQTWEAKNNGIISIDGDISALIVHPITPTLIMAGTASGIPYIYRSENRGESCYSTHRAK